MSLFFAPEAASRRSTFCRAVRTCNASGGGALGSVAGEVPVWPAKEMSRLVGEIGTMVMCEYDGAEDGKPSGLKVLTPVSEGAIL